MRTSSAAGVNWVGALGPVDLTVAATGIMGSAIGSGDDLQAFDAGVLLGFGGFSIGGNIFANTDADETQGAAAGLKYGFGAASVSVGYVFNDPDQGDSTNSVVVSADIGLLPGVTLKGDVAYKPKTAPAPTMAWTRTTPPQGVVTVQLDY